MSIVQIRKSVDSDRQSIVNITQANFKLIQNSAQFNWTEELIVDELSKVPCLVAEIDQQIVGFLCYRDLVDLYEISVLATSPEFKKQGIQMKLIQSLQIDAAGRNRGVILEVHVKNEPAKCLYLKMGFHQINKRKSYYNDGSDALVMKWVI